MCRTLQRAAASFSRQSEADGALKFAAAR